jgi:PhnB protein
MMTLHPWINFNGNAEEAFTFYKSVFGGDFASITRFKDVAGPDFKIAEQEADKIMRIVLSIGNEIMLIGNDVPSFMGTVSENENRSKMYVGVDGKEEADRIFTQLSAGGQVEVPPDDSAEGAYFGMFRDKYGIEWVIELNASK